MSGRQTVGALAVERGMRAAYEAECLARHGEKPEEENWQFVIAAYRKDKRFAGWVGTLDGARAAVSAAIGVLAEDAKASGRMDVFLILNAYQREAASDD